MATPPKRPSGPSQNAPPGLSVFGPPAEPGEVGQLGPYRIVRELGRGGMGAVYAAVDSRLDRRLALKVMLPQYSVDPAAKSRFLREARAAACVRHDNVVTVYEADERDGVPYIAMEFLRGYPLDEYLQKKGNPTVPQVLRIATEAGAGLAAAHKLGMVHRDIKPANLWLEAPNGRVKVLDFGLARPVDAEIELTQSGAVVGTPAYMSPEQARGEKVDARSDLFSLGVVMYRLCTGKLPFEGGSTMAVLMALGTQDPPPVRELNPGVPEALAALIQQLLAKKPDARPQTTDEVVRQLRFIAQEVAGLRVPPLEGLPLPEPVVQGQVVSVPIQVTVPPPEANPFAELDADLSMHDSAISRSVARRPVRKKPDGKIAWMFGGVGVLLVAAVAVVVIFNRNKDSSKAKIEVPEKPTARAAPNIKDKNSKTLAQIGSGGQPLAAVSDPDRKGAEYVLFLGGQVRVRIGDKERDVKAAVELPKEPFTLTWISLPGTKVTDSGLANFKDCKDLSFLDLASTAVTDAGLVNFKDRKDIWFLNLSGTRVTDAGLANFKDLKRLGHLGLHGTAVTDAGFANFKGCTSLGYLGLYDVKMTDTGLANFKDCKDLNHLGLHNTGVTDAGLALFKDCKVLKELHVVRTQVTPKALEAFHTAVPGCKIEHDGGTIQPK